MPVARALVTDLHVGVGDGPLVGQGISTGRIFGIDATAILSDRSIEIRPLIDRLLTAGVGLVRTQATAPRPASRQPQCNWYVCPNADGQLVEWREIRDTRVAALMAAGIRVHLDLFDETGLVHSAAHLALRDPAARAVERVGGPAAERGDSAHPR